ncbi:collagen-like protein [Stagnimonas aquatica]|uniref:Collagen-like protein n=2 Tax=Stagnimonas aquatica TaxID=2689987 RepID=A0A3N0VMN2_9GAMM|nr:collagen-like protein [Stagnimonas aquatica]
MLIAAWYAAPAAADLQIYSASILSNTLYIDGREFTPPSSTIEPLIQLNGSTLQVLQKSDDHLEARVPSGFQLSPGVSYQLYVSSLGDPNRFGSLTKDQNLAEHSASLALVAPSGAAGATGATGATGPAGAKGATGATGAAGTAGAKGATGATGAAGAKGATGATGAAGTAGAKGATGATGATGAAGAAGAKGATGATGAQGLQGVQGPQGIQGLKGATGATGPTGGTGATGATGIAGATGATGAEGGLVSSFQGEWSSGSNYNAGTVVTHDGSSWLCTASTPPCFGVPGTDANWTALAKAGAKGATGAASTVAGPAGATGATGATGPAGPAGATGIQGPAGATGPAGPQGATGATGSASTVAGPAGATGATGPAGPVGATGAVGPMGATGAVGPAGATGATGAAGAASTVPGPAGAIGPTGATGPAGPTGATGASGNATLSGSGAPANTLGSNGDFYVDTTNKLLYGPKASGAWPATGIALGGGAGGGATQQLFVAKTTAQTTALGSSISDPDIISWGTASVSPPAATGNTFDGTVFTVGTAGLYQITLQVINEGTTVSYPAIQMGPTWNDGNDFYGFGAASNGTLQNPHKARGWLNVTTYFNVGDTFRVRVASGSTVLGITLTTDGSTNLRVVKLD